MWNSVFRSADVSRHPLLAAWVVTAALAVPTTLSAVADDPAGGTADDELFADLGQELLEESAREDQDADPTSTGPVEPPEPGQQSPPLDEQLLDQLGEDFGEPRSEDNPYERISRQMRVAEHALDGGDVSGTASRAQQQVLDDLAALLEQMRKQRQRPPGTGSSQPQQSQRSQPEQPQQQQTPAQQPSAGQQSLQESQAPVQDSTTRVGHRPAESVDMGAMEDLFKDLWGHLPQRDRERMVESPFDRFLPEYEWEIERYFRRLAEDPDLREIPTESRPPESSRRDRGPSN